MLVCTVYGLNMLFPPDQQLCNALIEVFKVLAKLLVYACIEVLDHVTKHSGQARVTADAERRLSAIRV